jgi:hypothetical protein
MKTIVNLREILLWKKILAFILIIVGIGIVFTEKKSLSAIFLFAGLYFFLTEGTEIDIKNKRFRSIKSIFGISFGEWQACPDIEYISVFKTKENIFFDIDIDLFIDYDFLGNYATFKKEVILLNIFFKENNYFTAHKTTDKNEAFKVAEQLKSVLNIEILDAT